MKAQLRTFETIIVVFIFFIMLGLGLIFYGNSQKNSVDEELQKGLEARALSIAEQVQSLPELQCSTQNIVSEKCFEELKLDAMGTTANTRYFDAFGFAEIKVTQIYPAIDRSWTVYTSAINGQSPKPDFKNKIAIQIPVTIADAEGKNKFGMLTVDIYE